ncbi:MAG: GTP 3',8-cyclase MoaA [Cellulomonadaceae bacterium]|jgi:cyclic pyranopterin phosphate synthase|nr:GTP 3',8-cyclase MoaA [Cellulomonadaceae bacterium]
MTLFLMTLADSFGRVATDLRVSLTDRCNLRCTYCMPAEGLPSLVRASVMTHTEVVRLVGVAVALGVDSVRFTGGEPLLRGDLVDIVRDVATLTPRPEIALTTNAIGLDSRAVALAEAGVDRVNISLDTVNPDLYASITRRALFHRAVAGVEAASAVFAHVKVNAVLTAETLPGAATLVAWCLERGIEPRFIEEMPFDADHRWNREEMVTAAQLRADLADRFTLEPDSQPRAGAPAERYAIRDRSTGASGRLGIIASVTEPFCSACTRTRLTAAGTVRSCLFDDTETDLLTPLRAGASDAELADLWRGAMRVKRAGHTLAAGGEEHPAKNMSAIGG